MAVFYRVYQFWQLLAVKELSDKALSDVAAVLSKQELALFLKYLAGEQWHSYRVWQTLQKAGQTHPDLQVAALLHDVGKTRAPLTIWQRSLIVLVQKLLPGKLAAWGQGEVQGWQRPFVVKAQHPAWGAEMAAQAGSSPLAVSLIRSHQDALAETAVNETDHLLRWLQWADNQN